MSLMLMKEKGFRGRLFRWLASVRLSVVVMVAIGAICAYATFYEMRHGTPAVQRDIYGTPWFALLLGLLGLNVLASMLSRWPWSKHHLGFVAAHVGILLVLVGSLVSLYRGLDSRMALYEGETSDRVTLVERSASPESAAAAIEMVLPFRVTLLRFNNEAYPGSRMAATYESSVRIDDRELGSFETLVAMNHPLHHRGYIFFQSSFVEGRPMISIFSVARAPGLPLVYLGTALIGAGILWMFYGKPWLARRQAAQALAAIVLSLSLPLAGEAAGGADLAPLRQVAIQDGGRVKPLDTFARELAKRVQGAKPFGFERVAGLEPIEWLLASLASPERWQAEAVVRVTHAGLRQAAGLPAGRDRFSLHELAQHEGLRAAVTAVRAKLDAEHDLDPIDRELLELENTLVTYQGVTTGESLRVVPHPANPKAAWFSLADLQSSEAADIPQLGRLRALSGAMLEAYRAKDLAGVATAARAFSSRLRELAPAVYPDAKELRMEVHYNTLHPFRTAWLLYLAGFLVLLASFPLASRRLMLAGYAALVAGFLVNSYGMLLRVLISGRPPVTNMYETIVFVAWGGVLFALVFEAFYKTHVFAACAGALGAIALIIACSVPIFDGAISPLVPVLRDNMWLTVHVLTIMLGYAAFTLAMGIGHLNLGLYFLRPADVMLFKRLSLFLYRALQLGTLFLAVGTLLGGVWASYSWGRFWGWDPKETWALIALLGYLAVLHGRFVGWIKDFGMAVGSIVGYLLVLMAWYGVNYMLGTGLHSYGFGSGGYWYVGSFVAFEVLVIAAAALRRRSFTARQAPAPSVAAQPAH